MSALREVFAKFGIDFERDALTKGNDSVDSMVGNLQTLGQVIAGAALVQGIANFAHAFVDLSNEIEDASAVLNVSTTDLQEWRLAAQLTGLTADSLGGFFVKLDDKIAENSPAIRRLGVATRDASGHLRSAADVMGDLADPISAISNPAERTAALVEIFGRQGARLGPLLSQGRAGVEAMRAELEELGGGVTPEAVAAAGELGDTLDRFGVATTSVKSRLAVLLLPALERLVAAATRVEAWMAKTADKTDLLEVSFGVLGIAAAAAGAKTVVAWVAAAAPFLALGLLLAGLILVIEDVWVGFKGGQSVIGDLGVSFEEWGQSTEGVLGEVVGMWEHFKGLLLSTMQVIHDITGLGVDLSGGDGDLAITNDPDEEAQAINRQVLRNRAERVAAGGSEDEVNDSYERYLATRQVRAAAGVQATLAPVRAAAVQDIANIRIDRIDTTGMTPEQASRMVEQAVRRAQAAQADDIVDNLGGQGA